MSAFDLVIAGAGFTGACFLIHYSQNANNLTKKICIIDPYITGRGPAYQKNISNLLLNVPAFRMSIFPDIPLDFVNWLHSKNYNYTHYDFVPRSIYGDYIEETFQSKLKLFSDLTLIKEILVTVKPQLKLFELTLSNGVQMNANQVLLSIGSPPPSNPIILNKLINDKNYISNPCVISKITSIPKSDSVFILGKGLTALDLLQLFNEHQAPVILQSRHGRFPRPHLQLNDEMVKLLSTIHFNFSENPSLLEIIKAFKYKIREEKVPWQLAMDVIRHQIPKIWPKLNSKDKKRFLNKLKPIWNVHRHRSPLSILSELEKNLEQKKIEVIKGEVENISKSQGSFEVTIDTQKGLLTRNVNWIINATGPNYNIHQHASPLVQQMIKDNILISDPLNFGIVLNDDHQLLKNLYFIGPLTLSKYLESTSVPDLRNQAKQFAEKLSS